MKYTKHNLSNTKQDNLSNYKKNKRLHKKKVIIGFHGAAGSGKDTAADGVPEAERLSFAKHLKDACQVLFNLTDEQLYDSKKKEEIIRNSDSSVTWFIEGKEASPRLLLQWLGTDILRNHVTKNFFVEHMKQRIEKSNSSLIVITDVRFPNEAEFIKSIGGFIIKIERPSVGTLTELTEHETEQGLPDELIDHVVVNDGTIENLHQKMSSLEFF